MNEALTISQLDKALLTISQLSIQFLNLCTCVV
jgi:hypothetical protein